EERRELFVQVVVVQDRRGPAAPRTQHVTVGEPAARGKAGKVFQLVTARDEITHVHVDRVEPSARKRGGHLDLAVDALLAQHRDARTRAPGDVRPGNVIGRIEGEL